jgi:hypothetical protein
MKTENYETLLDEARKLFAQGRDNRYIELQFAERGVADAVIDRIIQEMNTLRRSDKRQAGFKKMIYGASFLAAGILFSLISMHSESPVRFVLWGLAMGGALVMIKGLAEVMGL